MSCKARWAWLAVVVGIGVSGTTAVAQAPATSPAPTEAGREIPRVSNFAGFSGLMNLARGAVRVVAIVSPTSPGAAESVDAVAAVLRDNPSKRLRAYVVMVRASQRDTRLVAAMMAGRQNDRRIVYLWDEGGEVMGAYASSASPAEKPVLSRLYLYGTAVTFAGTPPTPEMTLRAQPAEAGPTDVTALKARAGVMVRDVESTAAAGNARN